MRTLPASARFSPHKMVMSVDFPAPFRPSTSKDLPWLDAKVDSAQNFVGAVALVDSLSF